MSAHTHRTYSRNTQKIMICFAEKLTDGFEQAELVNQSDGGIAFLSTRALAPGADILIKLADNEDTAAGNGCSIHQDYRAEVRWCEKRMEKTAFSYRIGVRIFSDKCMLCDTEIRHRDMDGFDLCESCRDRFCSMSEDTATKSCIEKILIGNVI